MKVYDPDGEPTALSKLSSALEAVERGLSALHDGMAELPLSERKMIERAIGKLVGNLAPPPDNPSPYPSAEALARRLQASCRVMQLPLNDPESLPKYCVTEFIKGPSGVFAAFHHQNLTRTQARELMEDLVEVVRREMQAEAEAAA